MRLGIDLDGVVANFNKGWIDFYNRQFGTSLDVSQVDAWDVIPQLTHFQHMGEFWEWAENLNGSSLFRHLDTFPDAVPALEKLAADGHEIIIVTTKPEFAIDDTHAWIEEKNIPTSEVHIVSRKDRVEADVFLDDAPHQLYQLRRHRPDAVVVRFARPWNHEIPGVETVESWAEFLELVDHLTEQE